MCLYLFWTIYDGECSFSSFSLKNQQGLLIDFTAFPHKLMELLELCLEQQGKESPKWVNYSKINWYESNKLYLLILQ